MALRFDKAVIRGEISNTENGRVTGEIWLAGKTEPLQLDLIGNCLRDLAGCRLKFVNPSPVPDHTLESVLADQSNGWVGDITASRKISLIPEPEESLLAEEKNAAQPAVANQLYIEWYHPAIGRLIIETTHCHLEISAPEWIMSEEEERITLAQNEEHFRQYLEYVAGVPLGRRDPNATDSEDETTKVSHSGGLFDVAEDDDDRDLLADDDEDEIDELDEFEWEQELREADRRAETYQEAFDKYKDHPERDIMIARILGWDWLSDDPNTWNLDAVDDDMEEWSLIHPNDPEEAPPPHHPLSQRAMDLALNIQQQAEEQGLIQEGEISPQDHPILTLVLHLVALGGKLASALDDWSDDEEPEPGFVIAMLKRAQLPLNEALNDFDGLIDHPWPEPTRQWLTEMKRELFDLRRDILDLMQTLRAQR